MALKIGIVGLPNVGKSTLFNALTRSRGAAAANYPFCTIAPNVGIVEVPDDRLQALAAIVHPEKIIPAAVEFVDIAGLVRGASKGEGLGNQFLSHIREVHAICEVIRLFPGGEVIHVEGGIDPKRDRAIIETELMLADLETIGKIMERMSGAARTGDKGKQREHAIATRIEAALQNGQKAADVALDPEESTIAASWQLLTRKPFLYACNISEEQLGTLTPERARAELDLPPLSPVILMSAKLEEELTDIAPQEGRELLSQLGVVSSGLDRLIAEAYRALGYITYFTAGPKEVRAWTITVGTRAPQAAGVIHTDFEKGFIAAATISYKDFIQFGDESKAKEAGRLRLEGKEYVVEDGDVLHFRFSVG